jgi:ATP-dependent Clp protease ATP-binding subunit ClpC
MFERYTGGARRAFQFARQEAVRYQSPSIESEHLLLGMLRESEALATRIGGKTGAVESLREAIESKISVGQAVTGSRDLPASADSKQVLVLAVEEAKRLGHKRIALGHFLLGILRLDTCFASKILQAHGATIFALREEAVLWGDWR